ncbi:RDD family protein [Microbacterium sp.]|uniref:RDD family protein n=1 Tax=Microbacterium sp. TaxID=51671 RepID=UPI003F72AE6D
MTQPASAPIAPIPRRAVGYLIDAFIAAALAIVLFGALVVATTLAGGDGWRSVLLIGLPLVLLLQLGWFVVYTLMQAGGGSIGMRAQGLRLVGAQDETPLGFGRALVRNIVFGLACSIVVGYFTPLFDGSGRFQGWHDKVVGSLMLSTRGAVATASVPSSPSADSAASAPSPPSATPLMSGAAQPPAPPAAVPAAPQPPAAPVAAPRPAPVVPDDGSLIAFVPGITQDAAPPRATPIADDLDATVQGRAEVPPAVSPPAPPAPVAPATPVASTRASAPSAPQAASDIEDTRISIPGHRLVFTWDDGTRVSVSRRTVFGRNPAPEEGAVIVSVRDETLSLSKTHFEAAAEAAGGWVLDRFSTNGMTLVRDGQRIACPAGQRVPVRLGDAIEIGDRVVTIGGYA